MYFHVLKPLLLICMVSCKAIVDVLNYEHSMDENKLICLYAIKKFLVSALLVGVEMSFVCLVARLVICPFAIAVSYSFFIIAT